MKATLISACTAALIVVGFSESQGALVISEVLFNEVSSDTAGEWIEIYNSGPAAIDLTNYKIGDEETSGGAGTGETVVQFPSSASIGPGVVQIVAVSAARFQTVYGFAPTYELQGTNLSVGQMLAYSTWDPDGGLINMSNTNDQALLLNGSDAVVDAVNWGNTSFLNPGLAQPVEDGRSYERSNPLVDTDTANDWQLGPSNATAALRSTPGVVPVPEPAAAVMLALGIAAYGIARNRR
jgi:hypothetical protein